MLQYLPVLKGIHPGFILERELKLRKIPKNKFALLLNEHAQTIVSITKASRKMNTALALKIEKILGLEEGLLMVLQVYYDIEQEKKKQFTNTPDLSKLRSVLFWDTTMASINWGKQKETVIKRVFERGNDYEKAEIARFYGQNTVNEVMASYGE
jgi:plasmid maintenance system antidote protein VapI